MKAMILAAGLGTRLRPLTNEIPKPLLSLGGYPLLHILICKLQAAGCEAVIINTHHLADAVEAFLRRQKYKIPVLTRYEPTLLETGGGIKNVADFWDDRPFLVINGDIYTNIDLQAVYRFHLSHGQAATMVLHDFEKFNNVWVTNNDRIIGFGKTAPCPAQGQNRQAHESTADSTAKPCLAFTGVQVLDPVVLDHIPASGPSSIIHVYCRMIQSGFVIQGLTVRNHYWHDIGSMSGYAQACREALARNAFEKFSKINKTEPFTWSRLRGDGSDRVWYRVVFGESSAIVVDHGPPSGTPPCEADAYYAIGKHLYHKGAPVPKIYGYDAALGLIAVEDLGDMHLQTLVRKVESRHEITIHYKTLIDILIAMGIEGAQGFDTAWTFQTSHYDRDLVLEKECGYFLKAFLQGYREMDVSADELKQDFEHIAETAADSDFIGFLHRDLQSRNILVRHHGFGIIDFQGGRLGPLQYDLASLLIDPYVELPEDLQEVLVSYYMDRLSERMAFDRSSFLRGLRYCMVTRNLQALGAFGFLSHVKGKKEFEAYIPPAVRTLKKNIKAIDLPTGKLRKIIEKT